MSVELTAEDRAMLEGDRGEASAMAMRIIASMADVSGAAHLLDVTSAHIDGCLYHGPAGLDFARRLANGGGRVAVPTTLNVSSLDLLHPELVHLDEATRADARALMETYVAMGCRSTWTCAPYQLPTRPSLGEHIAWAESNAIVFANSVLGARTDRYGDFIDICCAITGRAPAAGLHLDEGRAARAIFRLEGVPDRLLADPIAHAAVGAVVGRATGTMVPAIVGLPPAPITTEDHAKALGAAAASSGALAMFHAVGVTPEAPTLEAATAGMPPLLERTITPDDLREARDGLSTVPVGAAIGAVSIGTPHCSVREFAQLAALVDGPPHGRAVLRQHGTRRPRPSRARGNGVGGGRSRHHRGDRHVHVHHADHPGARRPGRHRFGEMGVVRPGQPGPGRRVRQHGGVRAFGDRRRTRPR